MLKRSNAVQFEGITAYIIQCLASVGSLENEVLTEVLIHMAKSMIKCVDSKGT